LAWLYMTGAWPTNDVDHIDGDCSNDRFNNLREATRAQNLQNLRQSKRKSKDLPLGVSQFGMKWRAQITINRRNKHLGIFSSQEAASAAYVSAKRQLHTFGRL